MLPLAIAAGAAVGSGLMSHYAGKADARRHKSAINDYRNQSQGALSAYSAESAANLNNYAQGLDRYRNTPEGVSAWMNPNTDYQLSEIAKQNSSVYGQGKLNSGAAMKGLQDRTQKFAMDNWQQGFNNMNTSNNQGIGIENSLYGATQGRQDSIFNAQNQIHSNALAGALGQPTSQQQIGSTLNAAGQGFNMFGNLMSM